MNAAPGTETRPATVPTLGDTLRSLVKPLASLQLTVALFAMSLVLIFFGTLAQKNAGIWTVVDQYFWSWTVMIDTQLFVQFCQIFFGLSPETTFSVPIPFPGGKLIGGLMFVNLIAAHAMRFKLSWRRAGIFTLHGGLLLMFVGEFITREFTVEQQMAIPEGGSVSHSVDTRNYELAILTPADGSNDRVVAVPVSQLKPGQRLALPELPFDLKVTHFFPNAELADVSEKKDGPEWTAPTTQGAGRVNVAKSIPTVSGVEMDKKSDLPTTRIELLRKGVDETLDSFLVSLALKPQKFELNGKTYTFDLRNTHYYKPYSVHLKDFKFDRYLGTQTAKNYSSDVQVKDPDAGVEFDKTIAMNEPMRYRGETFYQSSFTPDESTTILSVVQNPGWVIPYVSCFIVTLGLVWHFGMYLNEWLSRMLGRRTHTVQTRWHRRLPWIVLTLTALLIGLAAMPHGTRGSNDLDLARFSQLPVVNGGRLKPLDTVARVKLRQVNHKEFYTPPDESKVRPAIDWWLGAASVDTADPFDSPTFKAEVFRIESDQVLNLLGLPRRDGLRYSASEIRKKFNEFAQAVMKARAKPDKDRDLFDVKLLELWQKLTAHNEIVTGDGTLLIPPAGDTSWRTLNDARNAVDDRALASLSQSSGVKIQSLEQLREIVKALPEAEQKKLVNHYIEIREKEAAADPALAAWEQLFAAYRGGNAEKFSDAVAKLESLASAGTTSAERTRAGFESLLNVTAFYFWCIGLYVFAFILTAAAWGCYTFNPGLGEAFRKSAFLVLLFTFLLHTFTLFARMYLMDRPFVFVTNLYSTAVFIGWAAVGVSLVLEKFIPITLGCTVASVLGFLTTILAHNLAASGDTLEMMQAVLDTNFWLATHVTTINLGYSATYIAGLIGICYLVTGIFTPHLRRTITLGEQKLELGRVIGQILYGSIAAATVLSFVGTVLGGIWGDQSWGRFWGWDPKENGALMIVIWNALILHARWAGLVKDRGIAVLALVGNMITTWSYFGTNQLGVGLHAYGFSNTLAAVCVVMWLVNLALIAMGLLPRKYWASQPNPTGGSVAQPVTK